MEVTIYLTLRLVLRAEGWKTKGDKGRDKLAIKNFLNTHMYVEQELENIQGLIEISLCCLIY